MPRTRRTRGDNWVLLLYRCRGNLTPRITIWRKLKRLGVAQLGDGWSPCRAIARTREHLDWIAEEMSVRGNGPKVASSNPPTLTQERELAAGHWAAARREESEPSSTTPPKAAASGEANPTASARAAGIRDERRRIHRREYSPGRARTGRHRWRKPRRPPVTKPTPEDHAVKWGYPAQHPHRRAADAWLIHRNSTPKPS